MIITGARTTGIVESPLLSNGHGGFGKRPGETGRSKDRHRAPGRLRGGKDHFAADRETAQQAMKSWGAVRTAVRDTPMRSATCRGVSSPSGSRVAEGMWW